MPLVVREAICLAGQSLLCTCGTSTGTHAVRFSPHWMELARTLFGEDDTCIDGQV